MKLLVCGSRDFNQKTILFQVLDELHNQYQIDHLVHGDARGADKMAGEWANERNIQVTPYPADWKKYKKAAGPIRNAYMLSHSKPDLVFSFPGGDGTEHMKTIAKAAGVKVLTLEDML